MRAACALVTAVLAMPASSVAAQNSGFPRAALGASAPRAIYGEQLRRFLLANGVSVQVMWPERPGAALDPYQKAFPRLILFGRLTDSLAFQILTEGDVLANAKAAGFAMVEIAIPGRGSRWYDLTGADLPTCDIHKRLCL